MSAVEPHWAATPLILAVRSPTLPHRTKKRLIPPEVPWRNKISCLRGCGNEAHTSPCLNSVNMMPKVAPSGSVTEANVTRVLTKAEIDSRMTFGAKHLFH